MSSSPTLVERLEAELTALNARTRKLESELAQSRKTIDGLLAQDLESSEDNSRLREGLWEAHQRLTSVCTCTVCMEVEQSRAELDGLWLYD